MKNRFLIFFSTFFFFSNIQAQNLEIESKEIILNKENSTSIFKNKVKIKTIDGKIINSNFAEYNKNLGFLKLRNNILVIDEKNNTIKADYAEYYEEKRLLNTIGFTKIITSENYIVETEDITFDNKNKYITSNEKTVVNDQNNNKIFLESFKYELKDNIFKWFWDITY